MVKLVKNMTKAELIKHYSALDSEKAALEKRVKELETGNTVDPSLVGVTTLPQESSGQDEYYEEDDFDIRPDTYVKVISLCPHPLNLRTAPFGGKSFRFRKLGN